MPFSALQTGGVLERAGTPVLPNRFLKGNAEVFSVNSKTNYCWEFSSILSFSLDVFLCTGVNTSTFEDKAVTLAPMTSRLLQLH